MLTWRATSATATADIFMRFMAFMVRFDCLSLVRRSPIQQAAAIAIRRTGDTFEVCLIRKRHSERWKIPKGMIDPGDTPEETALNEAWEEAGLKGRLLGDAVGTYEYEQWHTRLVVAVYVMEVLEEHDDWLEGAIRERKWTSFAEAASLLKAHPVRPLLDRVETLYFPSHPPST